MNERIAFAKQLKQGYQKMPSIQVIVPNLVEMPTITLAFSISEAGAGDGVDGPLFESPEGAGAIGSRSMCNGEDSAGTTLAGPSVIDDLNLISTP